jgi:NAD dependent epimerase/dehydratase family enzyme
VNICSPNPLRNREFMRALRASWRQPVGLAAPAWMIEIGSFLLRTESELVLKSRQVIPGRLLGAGFSFIYPEWPAAAQELVTRYRGASDKP